MSLLFLTALFPLSAFTRPFIFSPFISLHFIFFVFIVNILHSHAFSFCFFSVLCSFFLFYVSCSTYLWDEKHEHEYQQREDSSQSDAKAILFWEQECNEKESSEKVFWYMGQERMKWGMSRRFYFYNNIPFLLWHSSISFSFSLMPLNKHMLTIKLIIIPCAIFIY